MRKRDPKHIFGRAITYYRRKIGLSQEKLAEIADLHRTYVSDIERGNRNVSLTNILKLCTALQIAPAKLFKHFDLQSKRLLKRDFVLGSASMKRGQRSGPSK
jgi:transcriptional regulator with XRE-family HTH domain